MEYRLHDLPEANRMELLAPVEYQPGIWETAFERANPMVVRGFVETWPAYATWSLDWLKSNIGDAHVHASSLEASGITDLAPERRVFLTLSEVLDRIAKQNVHVPDGGIYLGQRGGLLYLRGQEANLAPLLKDVVVPEVDRRLKMVVLWVGSGRNTTYTHFDPLEGILGTLRGRKRLIVFPPEETGHVYPSLTPKDPLGTHVELDRTEAFPEVASARYWDVTLEQGDAIYLPPGHWHCVSGEGLNIAVSQFWFVKPTEWITNPALRALATMRIRTGVPEALARMVGRR
jgi:hypothetical protein